jgi:class 3 adenylate cyclase
MLQDFLTEGTRRLAAIMFTDTVGHTALSPKNEAHALQLLEEHHKVTPVINSQDSRSRMSIRK